MKLFAAIILLILVPITAAQASQSAEKLPPLEVDKLGELIMEGDEFDYRQWQSDQAVNKVHVLQYFPGTMSASKTFEPFTDFLQATYELGTYHVTTIINLDAAMWGTSGFVISEVKKSKRQFPASTLVLDKTGKAVDAWQLGEQGLGLFILDSDGRIRFQTRDALSNEAHEKAAAIVDSLINPEQASAAM